MIVFGVQLQFEFYGVTFGMLNESKNLLNENGISIPTPTPKPPLFHYISFIKTLSLYKVERVVEDGLIKIDKQINTSKIRYLVLQELLKAFMNQISSLKVLNYCHLHQYSEENKTIGVIPFVSFPGAKGYIRI